MGLDEFSLSTSSSFASLCLFKKKSFGQKRRRLEENSDNVHIWQAEAEKKERKKKSLASEKKDEFSLLRREKVVSFHS